MYNIENQKKDQNSKKNKSNCKNEDIIIRWRWKIKNDAVLTQNIRIYNVVS